MKWPATSDKLKEAGYESMYPTFCKACDKPMVFFKTANGKAMPLVRVTEETWQPHFIDCIAAHQFRKKKAIR